MGWKLTALGEHGLEYGPAREVEAKIEAEFTRFLARVAKIPGASPLFGTFVGPGTDDKRIEIPGTTTSSAPVETAMVRPDSKTLPVVE